MPWYKPKLNPAKLDEIVLYISERNLTNEHFTKLKLHHQLWMADFRHFELHRQSITGSDYIRTQHGPFCAALDDSLTRLKAAGSLITQRRDRFGHFQQRQIPLRGADLAEFSGEEIASVEDILWETWQLSARQLAERARLHTAWLVAEAGASLGYDFADIPVDEPLEEALRPPLANLAANAADGSVAAAD